MALHWAMFLPLPLVIAFVVAIVRANASQQRELAAARLLLGLGLIAGVSSLLGFGN